jgi:hypothetical protein
VLGGKFKYHGDEETVPPLDYAIQFASDFTFGTGITGPTRSWSFLSSTFQESAKYMKSGAVAPLLLERLDESLIALRHEMGWSIADIVVMKPRKALSKHPRASDWPPQAVQLLNASLTRMKEFAFYETAKTALQDRLDGLSRSGVDLAAELALLQALRSRVTEVRSVLYLRWRNYMHMCCLLLLSLMYGC